MKYPERKCIAVDVDGTLLQNGAINQNVVAYIRARVAQGFEVYVWSARGKTHAQKAVDMADLDVLAISKPSIILDDAGWSWVRYTRSASRDEVLAYSAEALSGAAHVSD